MKFKKPPVVETWITIEFDPNENKQQWDIELVQKYVHQFQDELPKFEATHEKTLQVKEVSSTDFPEVIDAKIRLQFVRLWNESRSRMLQVGDDQLGVHMLKSNEDTPGYSKVREAMEPKLEEYLQVFQPTQIRHATLHYLDIIDIPMPESKKIDLKDYFPYVSDLPEKPFGMTGAITQQFQVECPVDSGPLFIKLQNMPAPSDLDIFRFRLEWHKRSSDVNSLDLAKVWRRMDVSHDYMRQCFTSLLSETTLKLFDPASEEGKV